MSKYVITYGNKRYFLKKLTSTENIYCTEDKRGLSFLENEKFNTCLCYWTKKYNFGGDVLEIKRYFEFPKFNYLPKKHWWSKSKKEITPEFLFWSKEFIVFKEYKKQFGEDKTWIDYCKFVAEKTNSVKQFEEVCENSKIIEDTLKEMEN